MYDKEIVISPFTKNGYQYFLDKDHPLAPTGDARVLLHRRIASIKVSRWLTTEEHVHHIDGNKLNNTVENLQILTNEEHAKIHNPVLEPKICQFCGIEFIPECNRIKYCSPACAHSFAVKNKDITKEILDELIPKMSWLALGEMFGYSDNGIKKRAKALGCDITKAKYRHKKI